MIAAVDTKSSLNSLFTGTLNFVFLFLAWLRKVPAALSDYLRTRHGEQSLSSYSSVWLSPYVHVMASRASVPTALRDYLRTRHGEQSLSSYSSAWLSPYTSWRAEPQFLQFCLTISVHVMASRASVPTPLRDYLRTRHGEQSLSSCSSAWLPPYTSWQPELLINTAITSLMPGCCGQ